MAGILQWPWPWSDLFGGPMQYGAVIFGLLLLLAGLLYVPYGLAGGANGPLRVVTRRAPAGLATGLAGGLMVGLALGLAGGLALALAPLHVGTLVPPYDLPVGLALGVGCGIVFGWAAGWVGRLPRGLVAGAAVGLLIGLAAFQLVFGPTAGFGPETDAGVGTEVALAFGLLGGLAGALIGVLVAWRAAPARTPGERTPRRHWLALGGALGAGCALIIGVVGWLTGMLPMMLPYYGGFTDCAYPANCAAQPSPLTLQILGGIYGLGLFTLGGALIGALVGALGQRMPASDGPTPHAQWAALAAGFVAGMAAGLTTALQHADYGGPAPINPAALPMWNPQAGALGLAAGLAGGLALGVAGALVFGRVARPPGRRALLLGAILIVLGLVAWTLPSWFTPLIGIDVS